MKQAAEKFRQKYGATETTSSQSSTQSIVTVTDEQKSQAEAKKAEGNALLGQTNYPAAVDKYTQAIRINPNNAIYYANRAAGNMYTYDLI